jgi:hypothetical protein
MQTNRRVALIEMPVVQGESRDHKELPEMPCKLLYVIARFLWLSSQTGVKRWYHTIRKGDDPEMVGAIQMIDDNTSKLSRKVDGKFSLTVGENPDIYKESAVIVALEEKLEGEKEALASLRKYHTITLFRGIIREHEAKYGIAPTRCLLNYREFQHIVNAPNDEDGAHYQSHYNETAEIDGITICKGCNTKPGEFRLETQIPE